MKPHSRWNAVLIAVLAWSIPAWAQDAGFYVGGSFGQATYRDKCPAPTANAPCDDDDDAWRLFGGYQFNRYLSLELGFADLGRTAVGGVNPFFTITTFRISTIKTEVTAWDLAVIAALALGERFSVFGRAGFYWADLERRDIATISGTVFSPGPALIVVHESRENDSGGMLGLGVRFDFARHLSVRAEWLGYKSVGKETRSADTERNDIHVLSAGLLYRF